MADELDNIAGMTLNERLWHFGLFAAFDQAVRANDIEVVVAVLLRAQLPEASARASATAVLANPARFGFTRPAAPNT